MRMKTSTLHFLAILAALAVAGCAGTKLEAGPPAPGTAARPGAPAAAPGAPTPPVTPQATAKPAIDPLDDPKSILARRSVYFDFDQWTIGESDAALIEAHAAYLVDHPARTVRIEGNCDERGGHEYNLALAQRRANAVRLRLIALGVPSDRIETLSLGKENPRNPGHDEEAWAENRRSDIVYTN